MVEVHTHTDTHTQRNSLASGERFRFQVGRVGAKARGGVSSYGVMLSAVPLSAPQRLGEGTTDWQTHTYARTHTHCQRGPKHRHVSQMQLEHTLIKKAEINEHRHKSHTVRDTSTRSLQTSVKHLGTVQHPHSSADKQIHSASVQSKIVFFLCEK